MRPHFLLVPAAVALFALTCSSRNDSAAASGGSTGGQGSGGSAGSGGGQQSTTSSSSSGSSSSSSGSGGSSPDAGCPNPDGGALPGTYDKLVLCDNPIAFWAMDKAPASEPDLTGNGNSGDYKGGAPKAAALPNGEQGADFNGSSEYLTVPSNASMSIATTGSLTWEAWIRPDVLQFPNDGGNSGYVDWMGKCEQYSPTCEWEARMYDTNTMESPNRPNRLSVYVFNPSAGLGSGADWQPTAGLLQAGQWYHVVGEYTTLSQPSDCANVAAYPGSINVWVNGVAWDHAAHGQTGCMSQYAVVPAAKGSALNIGSMALDTWFAGAVAKVAIYDYLLSEAQISLHYSSMTGNAPAGSCTDTCSF